MRERGAAKSRGFAHIDLLCPVLPRIAAPLGGIGRGERDITAYPWVDERRDLLRQIQPDAFFAVVPGAGHWVMYEAAEAFNRVRARPADRARRKRRSRSVPGLRL